MAPPQTPLGELTVRSPRPPLPGFKGLKRPTLSRRGREGEGKERAWKEGKERGKGKGKWRGGRVDIAWPPTFSLVYATPLLQHQARFGLNRALATECTLYHIALCMLYCDICVGRSHIRLRVAEIGVFCVFTKWRPSAVLDLLGAYLDHWRWTLGRL